MDYAANQGCEWVVLTNGVVWQAYRIAFEKPIQADLVLEVNLAQLSPKRSADIDILWLISREGVQKSGLAEYFSQREALSRFTIGALLQTDTLVDVLRRELRRVSPDVKIEADEIRHVLVNDVIKREVLEGDRAQAAKRAVARAAKRPLKKASTEGPSTTAGSPSEAWSSTAPESPAD